MLLKRWVWNVSPLAWMFGAPGVANLVIGLTLLYACFGVQRVTAARLDVGPKTCSQQRDHCVVWRQRHGPWGSEEICLQVYRVCMRSGVWDGRIAFPYGGARMTGMVRQ